jgi:hypothetical protein
MERKEFAMMKVKTLSASVAAALMLGGAAGALAQEYYVIQPAPSERIMVQPAPSERVVVQPAQPMAAVPGERMTVSYTVDDPYPFPSPQTHVTQSGVFVPTAPSTSDGAAASRSWAHRNFNTNGNFNTD